MLFVVGFEGEEENLFLSLKGNTPYKMLMHRSHLTKNILFHHIRCPHYFIVALLF